MNGYLTHRLTGFANHECADRCFSNFSEGFQWRLVRAFVEVEYKGEKSFPEMQVPPSGKFYRSSKKFQVPGLCEIVSSLR